MKQLSRYIKPHLLYIIFTLSIKFAATYAELWIPTLMETMLDDKVPTGDVGQIYLFGGLMILCACLCLVLNITANRMTAFSSGKITKAIRHDLFQKLQSLSARQMDELTVPSAESRLTSDTYNVNQMLTRLQRMGIRAPILLIGGIFMLVRMDWTLALILVVLLPIIAIVVYFVTKKSVPLHSQQQTVLDDVVHIETAQDGGILAGSNVRSILFAVYRFLKLNGCRFLFPGAEGEYIPLKPIAPQKYHKLADHRLRGHSIEGCPSVEQVLDYIDWHAKEELNTFGSYGIYGYMNRYYSHQHNETNRPAEFLDHDLAEKQWRALFECEVAKRGQKLKCGGTGYRL